MSSPWPLTRSPCSVWYCTRLADRNIWPPPPPVRAVSTGSGTGCPVEFVVLVTVQGASKGEATHSSALDTCVCVGLSTLLHLFPPPVCPIATITGIATPYPCLAVTV